MTTTESAIRQFVINRTVDVATQRTREARTDLDRFTTWIGPEGVENSVE